MLTLTVIHIFSFIVLQQNIENLLGKSKLEIQQTMSNQYPDYTTNNFGIKQNDNTLRFYNSKKDATLIFYFTNQQKCKHIKFIEDIENLDQRIQEFNKKYTKVAALKWKATISQRPVTISIEKEEYNFTIIFQ
ncbi:MAG: hypothetical protein N2449_00060 [Bacteroidales bacterium]|nr:hypothetical protein [Bacteroidales bacterium]